MPHESDATPVPIPDEFRDLFESRALGHLATVMPDGSPQVTPVWIDYDGTHVIVNTAKGRVKTRNMEQRPAVAVEVMDGESPYRYLSIRGRVVDVIDDQSAEDHIDKLAHKYLGVDKYPTRNRAPGEVRVMFKIAPLKLHGFPAEPRRK
jgi:PPOX class probable F420-dependent enzyme